MPNFIDAQIDAIQLNNLTTAPSTPSSGRARLYVKNDDLCLKDDTGSETVLGSGAGGSQFASGTYTGDGNATQAITGVGFQPKLLHVYSHTHGGVYLIIKSDNDGLNAAVIADGIYKPDIIISLDTDGFTVGDGTGVAAGNQANINNTDYSWQAWG